MDDRTLEIDIRFRDEDPEATAAALGEAGAAEVKTVQQKGFTGIEFVLAPDGTRSTLHQPSQVELDALLGLGGS